MLVQPDQVGVPRLSFPGRRAALSPRMRRFGRAWGVLVLPVLIGLRAGAEPDGRAILIVHDFSSEFDQGRSGARLAQILRSRARRSGKFVTLEDMDLEDAVRRSGIQVTPETSSEQMAGFARSLKASHVIWGGIRMDNGEYRITAKVLELADGGAPRAREWSATARGPQNIPSACGDLLATMGVTPSGDPSSAPNPEAEAAWRSSPNLCRNPGFEDGRAFPTFWRVLRQDCIPHVTWDVEEGHGRVLQYSMPASVAANQGIMTLSAPIPVKPGGTYRLQAELDSREPTIIFFVKGYAWLKGTEDEGFSWREVWQRKDSLDLTRRGWETQQTDLHPGVDVLRKGEPIRAAHRLKFVRIGLYAYWPEGRVRWDNVQFRMISPPTDDFIRKLSSQAEGDPVSMPEVPEE